MDRRKCLYLSGGLASLAAQAAGNSFFLPAEGNRGAVDGILGVPVHKGYNHPHSARTWTVEDRRDMPTD